MQQQEKGMRTINRKQKNKGGITISFLLDISGPVARFTHPALRGQGYSYDIPTPSALVGIIESVYWHPGVNYHIKRFWVLNDINPGGDATYERKRKVSGKEAERDDYCFSNYPADNTIIRYARDLHNVHYVVEFAFTIGPDATVTEQKAAGEISRLLSKKFIPCYQTPYLGISEFTATVKGLQSLDGIHSYFEGQTIDYGFMPHSVDYNKEARPVTRLYHAVMIDGCVDAEREVREP